MIYTFNKDTKKSIKFGYNSTMKFLQNPKYSSELKMIFFFYKDNVKILIDLLLLKVKESSNVKVYIIDSKFKEDFKKIFTIKQMICFSVLKIEKNEVVLDHLLKSLEEYNSNNNGLVPIFQVDIRESVIEK